MLQQQQQQQQQQHHHHHHHHHQQQQQLASTAEETTTISNGDAPPKQVAMAMDRLGQASRLIADIRISSDRLLEAVIAADFQSSSKIYNFILKEDSAMRHYFQDLRNIGRQLESTGVLNDALRSRSNSWGLHMPLVCPDGAVVAYAWKRQLAGQAGASAVDRTRLALKSFTDQKRRFFPHLDSESSSKKQSVLQESMIENSEDASDYKTLSDTLECLEKEAPNLKIHTYERLDWLKRASLLLVSANEDSFDTVAQAYHGPSSLRRESPHVPSDRVAVIELFIPFVFRAIVSLHPVGSKDPDAVAFFSPDEGGSHVHARGSSVYNAFRHITEYSNIALQYFLGNKSEHWISSYQTLFTQACSKCGRILSMDRQSALFLPPVHRPYQNLAAVKLASGLPKNQISNNTGQAYHVSCSPPDV